MRTSETLVTVKVSYKMVARGCIKYHIMRMVRAFVGIGSVDTVVAPDSALVGLGVAGPVATPSAAACLPLQVHDLRRVSVIFRQDRLQAMPRNRVDTSTTRSLPFTTTMSCTKSAPPRAGPSTSQRYLSTPDSE